MPDETTGITIRTATDDTLRAILRPLAYAFGEEWSDDEFENERRHIEVGRVVGAFDGDTPVGCSGAYSFRLTTPGGEIGAAGVTLVGVSPTHRRRGILRLMMADLFAQARDRDEPVAILWASEAAIYQKFGYGMGTEVGWLDAVKDKVKFLRPVEPVGQVRIMDRDEAVDVCSAIYDARRPAIAGMVDRNDAKWRYGIVHDAEFMRGGNGPKVRAVLEVDGRPRAYTVYRTKADFDDTGPTGFVSVLEVVGLDPAAEQAMWQWLFSLDLHANIRIWRGPVPHPLTMLISEPRRLRVIVGDGLWLRILDPKAALEGRRYRGPGSVVMDVTDEFCPENAGRWQLSVPKFDGVAEMSRVNGSSSPDLALDISDLASVYLGAFRFGDLATAGRVTECRPGALADADALFATSTAPWNSTPF